MCRGQTSVGPPSISILISDFAENNFMLRHRRTFKGSTSFSLKTEVHLLIMCSEENIFFFNSGLECFCTIQLILLRQKHNSICFINFVFLPYLGTFIFCFTSMQFAYIPSSIRHQDSNPLPLYCKS